MEYTDPNYSSLSELESLSDSDWLDIASKASGDDDSVSGLEDSDREDIDERPASRQSFLSVASSQGHAAEGWEGIIENSSDKPTFFPLGRLTDQSHISVGAVFDFPIHTPPSEEEDPEDERVKAALDQSMMSTLSSSRSGSLHGSVQTSVVHSARALRLSFPDPTHSNVESLNTSFEDIAPSDAEEVPSDFNAQSVAQPGPEKASEPKAPPFDALEADEGEVETPITPEFAIFLYGSSPAAKNSVVDMLLEKWAVATDLVPIRRVVSGPNSTIRVFVTEESLLEEKPSYRFISVTDQTRSAEGDNSNTSISLEQPSLAIIFLPSFSEVLLPQHTLYLPMVLTDPLSMMSYLGTPDLFLEAEQQWENLNVTSQKLAKLGRSSTLADDEALEQASAAQVHNALRPLFSHIRPVSKVSAHALTILAVLSLMLGCIMKGTFQASVPTPTMAERNITPPLWGLLRPVTLPVNKSALVSGSHNAVIASSSRSLDVTVYNPLAITSPASASTSTIRNVITSPSITSTTRSVPAIPTECGCGCGLLTLPGQSYSTDIALRSTQSGLMISRSTPSSVSIFTPPQPLADPKGKGKAKATESDDSLYTVSTRIAGTIAQYFDFQFIIDAARKDIDELVGALDVLAQAIALQTSAMWEQSKGTVALLQDEFKERNVKATKRAKQLRDSGARWMMSLCEQLQDKVEFAKDQAKENAKKIKENIVAHREAIRSVQLKKRQGLIGKWKRRRDERAARRANPIVL